MRPVKLTLENFTCFRGQHVVDFTAFDLFAIAGPTGAGKTSILDAMVYALYGKVPRMSRNLSELISQGKNRMVVTFEFDVRGAVYRVVRKTRRTGVTEAQIERVEGDRVVPMADKVGPVKEALSKLLGLDFPAFTQSVVLPQNEFAKFLKSSGADRRAILTELLRAHVFKNMRERAVKRRDDLLRDVGTSRKRLEEDFGDATPQSLAEKQTSLEEVEKRCATLDAERLVARQFAEQQRQVQARCAELEARKRETTQLESQTAEVDAARQHLEAARRAERAHPALETARKAGEAATTAAEEARQAAEALRRALRRRDDAKTALAAVEADAATLADRRERREQLKEAMGALPGIEAVDRRVKALEQSVLDARAKEQTTAAAVAPAEAAVEASGRAVTEAAERLAHDGYDRARHDGVRAARDRASTLAVRRKHLSALEATVAQARQALHDKRGEAERMQDALREAADAFTEAEKAATQARDEHEAAQVRDLALGVRDRLVVGQPCPVCEQAVHVVPAHPAAAPDLKKLKKAADLAAKALDGARSTVSQRQANAASLAQRVLELEAALSEREREVADTVADVTASEAELCEVGGQPGGERIEELVIAEADRLERLAKSHERLEQAAREADQAAVRAGQALEMARVHADQAREQAAGLARDVESAGVDLASQWAQVRAITDGDPRAEHKALDQEIKTLEGRLDTAAKSLRDADLALATAQVQHDERHAASEAAAARARQDQAAADEAVAQERFATAEEAAAARLPRSQADELDGRVRKHDSDRLAVQKRIAELEGELAGRRVTADEAREAVAAADRLDTGYAEARDASVRLSSEIEKLQARVERAADLRARLALDEAEYEIYKRLSLDLESDQFRAWIIEDTFKAIVSGASTRLLELTSRYEMELREEVFFVLDNDNAREARMADTLSGGETFLASLALALELSEQIQASSGAVRLDSLFIDEGFGSLDPETLETVAQALESLTAGGRMVGIITHIPELTERLPKRVRVRKLAEGVKVVVD